MALVKNIKKSLSEARKGISTGRKIRFGRSASMSLMTGDYLKQKKKKKQRLKGVKVIIKRYQS